MASADQQRAKLLAQIHENPADDRLRQVFADWLIEHGDPRGELINIQLLRVPTGKGSSASLRRAAALLGEYGASWTGRLEPFLLKAPRRFARGFLDACALRSLAQADVKRAVGLSEWSTVRTLDVDGGVSPTGKAWLTLITDPVMRSLVEVTGAGPALFEHETELPFTSVGVALGRVDSHHGALAIGAMTRTRALPRLRHLDLQYPPEPAAVRPLWTSELAHKLTSFAMRCWTRADTPYEVTMARWVAEIFERAPWLERISVGYDHELTGWHLRFDGGDVSATFEVRRSQFAPDRQPLVQLRTILDAAPRAAVKTLRVTSRVAVGDRAAYERFRDELTRFPTLQIALDAPLDCA